MAAGSVPVIGDWWQKRQSKGKLLVGRGEQKGQALGVGRPGPGPPGLGF